MRCLSDAKRVTLASLPSSFSAIRIFTFLHIWSTFFLLRNIIHLPLRTDLTTPGNWATICSCSNLDIFLGKGQSSKSFCSLRFLDATVSFISSCSNLVRFFRRGESSKSFGVFRFLYAQAVIKNTLDNWIVSRIVSKKNKIHLYTFRKSK